MTQKEKNFTQFIEEHKRTIFTVCYMFSSCKEEVEDLFQDIAEKLWRGFDNFRNDSSPRTWIWRVAMNTCINWQKKRTNHLHLEMNVDLYSSQKDEIKQIQMLHDRIHQLGIFDRAIILLWLEELPYEEIASITGLSVKNVSVRLTRIKEQLKQMSNQ